MRDLKNMKYLIDTNIILDVLLKREPFCSCAVKVIKLSMYDKFRFYISASSVTDIYYIANQTLRNKAQVKNLLNKLLKIVSIAGVSEKEIRNALMLSWSDFEDSVQYSVALLQEMDGIITRNTKDYKESEIKIWEPEEFLETVLNSL